MLHTPYPPLEVSAHVTFVMAQLCCHKVLVGILVTQQLGPELQTTVQVHTTARRPQGTTLNAIDTHPPEFDSTLILIPGVSDEIPKSHRAQDRLKANTGTGSLGPRQSAPSGAPGCTHSISKACFHCLVRGTTVPQGGANVLARPQQTECPEANSVGIESLQEPSSLLSKDTSWSHVQLLGRCESRCIRS